MNHTTAPTPRALWVAVLAALISLGGCTGITPKNTPSGIDWQQHQQQLQEIRHWRLQGKLGVRLPQKNGSFSFNWQQQGINFDLNLSGLFGQGVMQLSGSPQQVAFTVAGEPTRISYEPDQVLEQQLGWKIPVEALQYWMRGIPEPNQPSRFQLNDQGQLAQLQQNGWNIEYSRYQQVEHYWLPQRMVLTYDDARFTLLAKRWQIPTAVDNSAISGQPEPADEAQKEQNLSQHDT